MSFSGGLYIGAKQVGEMATRLLDERRLIVEVIDYSGPMHHEGQPLVTYTMAPRPGIILREPTHEEQVKGIRWSYRHATPEEEDER